MYWLYSLGQSSIAQEIVFLVVCVFCDLVQEASEPYRGLWNSGLTPCTKVQRKQNWK